MADKKLFTALDLQNNRIKGVGAPVGDNDAATKASAQAQADAAKAAAEQTAAADATSKAATAKAEAIQAAAQDATSKAATAKAEAIQAAAQDATTKADTALTSAKTYADGKITALIGAAPATLDTLNELAAALGNDASFATTVTNTLGTKTNKFAANITGAGTEVSGSFEYEVAHNLNKADIIAQAFEGNDQVDVFIRKVNDNTLKVITGAALGSTTLRVVVVG
jgi:hypothetical protein